MLILFVLATALFMSATRGQDATSPADVMGRPTLITSPRTCLREVECAASQYCDMGASERLFTCQARGAAGDRCVNVFGSECLDGLYCGFVAGATFQPSCARQIPLGGACEQTAVRPCAGNDTICRRVDDTCAPFETGFAGEPCAADRDCQQDRGFYCMQGTCAAKKLPGAPCGQGSSNNECLGLCARGGTESSTGTCAPTQAENRPCREDAHCNRLFNNPSRAAALICNVPRGDVGRCVRETALIRVLGAPCTPSLDLCDARRGLSCRRAGPAGGFVCQQAAVARDSGVARYCTPGSSLSTCRALSGIPLSCRRDEGPDLIRLQFMGYFACIRRLQVVPLGRACHKPSFATCASGTSCQLIPGVRGVGGFRQTPIPPRFCVRTVGLGASCADKFSTMCAPDLACNGRRCVPSGPASSPPPAAGVEVTHVDVGVDCSQLPCVPGAVCATPEGAAASAPRECVLPTRVRGEGQLCFDTALARRVCAPGLICAQNTQGHGLLACRKPGPLGAVCQNDDECRGNLKCGPFPITSPPHRRCYNPALTLPLGASCDPAAPLTAPRCVLTTVQRQFIGNIDFELRCLPKANAFACQRVALLFQQCDPLLNITCISGAVCSSYGVCIPPS